MFLYFTVNPGQTAMLWDSGFLMAVYRELFADAKFTPMSSIAIQSRILGNFPRGS